jgi:hypothetical protein
MNDVLEKMSYKCEKCNKICRDSYDLKRHLARKVPCVKNEIKTEIQNKQQVSTVIENQTNFFITINVFGKEDLSHIDPERIIEHWRQINKTSQEEYVRAGQLVTTFHKLVNENPTNQNIKLPNVRSQATKVTTQEGTVSKRTPDAINNTIKTRAGQLVTFKDSIAEKNNRVFKSKKNNLTWKHIEKFNDLGIEHRDTYNNTRNLASNMKFELL